VKEKRRINALHASDRGLPETSQMTRLGPIDLDQSGRERHFDCVRPVGIRRGSRHEQR
jgi:hypothetical protein